MRVVNRLAIALLAIGLVSKLTAQQTAVIINLTEQTAYLLEDGRVALISPIASGKEGRETPTGNYRVINKDLNHQSGNFGLVTDPYGRIVNLNATPGSYIPPGCHYIPAPMPYFMEFRKYVGMHAGYLPGYPASHGCVRMPRDLAAEFFTRVQIGTPVKVIGSTRNVTRVRRAIPLVQLGEYPSATAFSDSQPSRSAKHLTQVRRAVPAGDPGRCKYAIAFSARRNF